ncbi:MAG TPA: GntR family transcriptional regulator [Smithella sp.]|nr:FadR family transcriptional regulator [Smithella sp.]MDM7985914.1 GntR family transcriptional regulator [Smithella sp.]HNY50795.1 GntR family transcriptional regulator [Smithella sp.]HOG90723.1 GntR family transcriptional regulator [Smithella sp.]HOU50878.1 GntR family transcriptional regulator [Smithella sp.]
MMQFDAIVAPTIRNLFVEKFVAMILSGKLAVGDRLPSERELAEQMKVSKTVIHAGLKELERMGFVSVNGRQGTFVANYAEKGTFETLAAILKFNGGRLDRETTKSLVEMRLAVEGQAVRMFAKSRTQEDIATLRRMIDEIREYSSKQERVNRNEMAQMLFRFHRFICLRSGNTFFPVVMNAFRDIGILLWEGSIRILGAEKTVEYLERFTSLLEEGKGEETVQALSDMFDYCLEHG